MRFAAMLALGGLSTVCAAATPQTDLVGAASGQATGSGSFKLSVFQIVDTVELDTFDVYLNPAGPGTEVYFVVYEAAGGAGWDLLWSSGRRGLSQGLDFQGPGGVGLMLEQGRRYGLGVYIPDGEDVTYYYGVADEVDLGWAIADDALWTANGTFGGGPPPDPAFGSSSTTPGSTYHMQVRVLLGDDADGDGVSEYDDCDDTSRYVYPGAVEACDELDNDCDGQIDEDVQYRDVFPDLDGDGYSNVAGAPINICEAEPPPGYANDIGDCDDSRPEVNPGAAEICDGFDSDCDGTLPSDETVDTDLDGSPACADCDDSDPETFPGLEVDPCNGEDNDCDGEIPEGRECVDFEEEELVLACACNAGSSGGVGWVALVGLVALRRRR